MLSKKILICFTELLVLTFDTSEPHVLSLINLLIEAVKKNKCKQEARKFSQCGSVVNTVKCISETQSTRRCLRPHRRPPSSSPSSVSAVTMAPSRAASSVARTSPPSRPPPGPPSRRWRATSLTNSQGSITL